MIYKIEIICEILYIVCLFIGVGCVFVFIFVIGGGV